MKRLLLLIVGGLLLCSTAGAAPLPVYQINFGTSQTYSNTGALDVPPMIDAKSFVNYGTFGVFSTFFARPDPFGTYDTLNYTNFGTMTALPGFRFELQLNSNGRRMPAANFVNYNPGVIEALDSGASGYLTGGLCADSALDPSFLIIHATNITTGAGITGNTGSPGAGLIVGAAGLMDIVGDRVDLSYSGLEALPVWSESVGNTITVPARDQFFPDVAIYDIYWARGAYDDNRRLSTGPLWDGTSASAAGINNLPAPGGGPANPFSAPGFTMFNPASDSYTLTELLGVTITNQDGSTSVVTIQSNVIKGAVFVGLPPGFSAQIGFGAFGSFPGANRLRSFDATVFTSVSNAVTGLLDTPVVYISDELGSDSRLVGDGSGNGANQLYCVSPQTERPANYLVGRGSFGIGAAGDGPPPPDFFLSTGSLDVTGDTNILSDTVTNGVVAAGAFAGYQAYFDDVSSRPQAAPGLDITNTPGRVNISANVLNLDHTRVRANGMIIVDTPHLISSSNAVIDCENINLDVGSTNGNLILQNLVPPGVARMQGNVRVWSASWTNQALVILQSYSISNNVDTNSTPPVTNIVAILSPVTNSITVAYHTFMFDATGLSTFTPDISVWDLRTRSANVTMNDSVVVRQRLLFDGVSLTLNGGLSIPGFFPLNPITGFPLAGGSPLASWTAANAPNLFNLTNNGTLSIVNEARFGSDRPLRYDNFVNTGSATVGSLQLSSQYIENRGTLASTGPTFVQGGTARFDGGTSISGGISQFSMDEMKLNAYQIQSVGKLFLSVTNALSDAGPGSGSTFLLQDGFALNRKPLVGDLLGTRIQTTAVNVPVVRIQHFWAAEDRGPTSAGYINNVAVGTLALSSSAFAPKFAFFGTGLHNGLYVDLLDLSGLSPNFLNEIEINQNLTIYFAAAKLPAGFSIPPNSNGIPQQAEEFLDTKFNGRLRWVPTFAGPNSSQSGFNKALLNSHIIDSDNDGTPNFAESDINSVFPTTTITVNVEGNGIVEPDLTLNPLIVGYPYTLVAHPADGSTFVGWDGPVVSTSPTITFTAEEGLAPFVATFTFKPIKATYNGLFSASSGVALGTSGAITLSTTKNGSFTGKISVADGQFSFSGGFDDNGQASVGAGPYTLELQAGVDHITGTVTDDPETFSADLLANRAFYDGKKNKAPMAGNYTMAFPGAASNNPAIPFGVGYATVKLNKAGHVTLNGVLGDGSKISKSTDISEDGKMPLYSSLYNGGGQILGWLTFVGNQEITGQFSWIKAPDDTADFYPDGFDFTTNVVGSVYDSSLAPVTGFHSGKITLSGGNLAQDIINDILINGKSKITNLSTNGLNVTINKGNGLFDGKVVDPETGDKVRIKGAILQIQDIGLGFFKGTNQTGRVTIEP